MKTKEILLLILIILIGVGFHYLSDLKIKIDEWDLDFPFRGESYQFEEHSIEAPADILEIINSHGSIQIEGSETGEIEIIFEKKVWRKNEQEAREIADRIKLLSTRDNQKLVLTTNRDSFRKKNFATSFRVRVPADTRIAIKNSYGLVRLARVKEVDLENRHGRVEIIEISGAVRVKNSYEKVSIMDVSGDCHLETRHSSARLSRIEGPVQLDCAHENLELFDLNNNLKIQSRHTRIKALRVAGPLEISGSYELISLNEIGSAVVRGHHSPLEIDGVRGNLDLETSYERVRISNLEGDLVLRAKSSRIGITGVRGGRLKIETSYEPVNLENFSGQLELKSKHSSLSLAPSSLDFPMRITTEYGNISFFWPESQTARLEASSRGGRISWQLSIPPDENTSNGTALVRAFSQATDRPEIKLSAAYGDIRILTKAE